MQKINTENMSDPVSLHMHTGMVVLQDRQTVAEAVEKFRRMDIAGRIAYLYVLDEDERLAGVVPVRRLLGSDPDVTIKAIMESPAVHITESSSLLEACDTLLARRFMALPVVDSECRLRGVIDLSQFTDEVLTSAQQQMSSAFQLIGVHVALGRRVSPWRSFRDRFPWLLCNIASGIVCAFIASQFQLLLSRVVLLAMFLTVVLALGESVSMQSMTITLQGLLGRKTTWRHLFSAARKELVTSVLLGLGCGGIIGVTVQIWQCDCVQALAVGGSIFCSIVTACLLGVAIPAVIHKLKIDPKVAAGPIVLASADVATLLFYFSLARWMLMQDCG